MEFFMFPGVDILIDAMGSILDTFVEAGWPQAGRLTYRLEKIYR